MEQHKPKASKQQIIDPGIIEVAISVASLSVVIIALPVQVSDFVIEWLTVPIVLVGLVSFLLSYLALGDLLSAYFSQRGFKSRGLVFGRERRIRLFGREIPILQWEPHHETGLAVRWFGISLIFLVVGILLNWIL